MNNPHVVWLLYRVQRGSGAPYAPAKPFEHETESFRLHLAAGEARFVMKEHFPSVARAAAVVDSFIEEWDFEAVLSGQPHPFRFSLERSSVIDRNPAPNPPLPLSVSVAIDGGLQGAVSGGVALGPLSPSPPSGRVALTPEVRSMYARYSGYLAGNEPLASMVYFCLTVLEESARRGGLKSARHAAARAYRVAPDVLGRIGELTARKGGAQARKAQGLSDELSPSEVRFLREAVRTLIRRAAEVARDPSACYSEIRLCDLPLS